MPFTLADLLLGFLLPVVVSWTICSATVFIGASGRYVGRLMAPIALLVGFSAGYYALGLGPVIPRFDRDWLAIAAWMGLPASAMLACREPMAKTALILAIAGAAVLAVVLVPTWESLLPSLTQYRISLFVGIIGLFAVSLSAAIRVDRRGLDSERGYEAWGPATHWLCVLLALFFCVALMVLSGSLGFATVAIAALGAGIGVLLTCVTSRRKFAVPLVSLVPVWTFLVCGLVFTAFVNSSATIPLAAYVMLPVAPALSSTMLPRRGSATLRRHLLGALILCAVTCMAALGLAVGAQWESLTTREQHQNALSLGGAFLRLFVLAIHWV